MLNGIALKLLAIRQLRTGMHPIRVAYVRTRLMLTSPAAYQLLNFCDHLRHAALSQSGVFAYG